MKAITATWFETKIQYEKTQEDGRVKKVTEQYVLDALSFTEAEQRITEEMSAYISGEFTIKDIKPAAYKEVIFNDDTQADRWYKARLAFITIDEKTGKEKRTNVTYLVQARDLDHAVQAINQAMHNTMIDYEKSNITETRILDVYRHEP